MYWKNPNLNCLYALRVGRVEKRKRSRENIQENSTTQKAMLRRFVFDICNLCFESHYSLLTSNCNCEIRFLYSNSRSKHNNMKYFIAIALIAGICALAQADDQQYCQVDVQSACGSGGNGEYNLWRECVCEERLKIRERVRLTECVCVCVCKRATLFRFFNCNCVLPLNIYIL